MTRRDLTIRFSPHAPIVGAVSTKLQNYATSNDSAICLEFHNKSDELKKKRHTLYKRERILIKNERKSRQILILKSYVVAKKKKQTRLLRTFPYAVN